jgi:hypothetical protein
LTNTIIESAPKDPSVSVQLGAAKLLRLAATNQLANPEKSFLIRLGEKFFWWRTLRLRHIEGE